MTEREQFEIEEKRQEIFKRDWYQCRYPSCDRRACFLAHRICKSKMNIKLLGKAVIHHELNMVSVCDNPAHNDHFNIGFNTEERKALVKRIKLRLVGSEGW